MCLQDSVLAFWRHGMQGRGFKSNEVIFLQWDSRNCLPHCWVIMCFFDCRSPRRSSTPAGCSACWALTGGKAFCLVPCLLACPPAYLSVHLSVHLCVCRVVVLESRATDNPTEHSNLYILAGHENSYWEQKGDRTKPELNPDQIDTKPIKAKPASHKSE